MAALHQDGVRQFDLSIGNYAYKRRFGVAPLALAEITAALSWRGLPFAVYCVAALAAISVLFDIIFITVEFVMFGPLALFFLVIFPLPTVPPAAIGIPVLILSLSVILEMRRSVRASAPVQAKPT